MAKHKRRLLQLLLMLVLVSLIGHLLVDISGSESLMAFDLHAGCILPPLIALGGALALVTTLRDDDPIRRWRSLPPHVHPPTLLH